jgi:hypothetical protein
VDIVGDPDDSAVINWGDSHLGQTNSANTIGRFSLLDLLVYILAIARLGQTSASLDSSRSH